MSSYNGPIIIKKAKSESFEKTNKSLSLKRPRSLPFNYKFKENISLKPLNETIKPSIINRLKNKLEKVRSEIENNKDLYIDDYHKKICYYNEKIIEIKNKLSIKNEEINIKYMSDGHIKIKNKNHEEFIKKIKKGDNTLDFNEETYIYNIKYNDYNKKFINKISDNINKEILTKFINEQNEFIINLNLREIYNLKYYTYISNNILKSYINNTFDPSNIYFKIVQDTNDSLLFPASNLCFFFYQLLDYFTKYPINIYNNTNLKDKEKIPIENESNFIEFIKDNYKKFNIDVYDYVFSEYLKEIKDIFNKAPKTRDTLILYQTIEEDDFSFTKGFYKTNEIISTSLFIEKVFDINYDNNKIINKIVVNKDLPVIFLEGITLLDNKFEVIIPIGAILYIDNIIKNINYYEKKDIICPDESNNDIVKISNIIYCDYK